jgi:hypothetical protein
MRQVHELNKLGEQVSGKMRIIYTVVAENKLGRQASRKWQ